jgi:Mg2+ and Co2+ transporter CorA
MTEPRREPLITTAPADGATAGTSGSWQTPRQAGGSEGAIPSAGGGSGIGPAGSVEAARTFRIRLFDADRTDRELTFADALDAKLSERQLLWVDATAPMDEADAAALAEHLDLAPATRAALQEVVSQPRVALHGAYFTLTVATIHPTEDRDEVRWLQIVAGRDTVVTVHAEPIAFLDDMDSRIESDTLVGLIDAASFVAALLDATVTSYQIAADGIEDAVDRLDAWSLGRDVRKDLLGDLIELRRRITRLRRKLTSHRELFASLGRADFAMIAEGDVAAPFTAVAEHFERAIAAVEHGGELLLGSFDVHMTRTAQRTNEIVKILTIVSVFLLPGTVIAGFMGMNLKAPYSNDDPRMFWLVVLLIAVVAIGTFVVLRLRRWL